MGRVRSFQTNFLGGVVSDKVSARVDIPAYGNAAKQLTNFRLLLQGGVTVRPGSVHVANLGALGAIQTASFVFNTSQSYVLVFSNTRVDIYTRAGTLAASLTSTPWTTAMMGELYFSQRGDKMIVTHPDMPMQVITRTGATSFTRTAFAFETHSTGYPIYEPYYKFAAESVTLAASATTGSITLTTSADHWTSDHVSSFVRYKEKTVEITAYTDAQNVTGTVRETLPATAADTDWDENVFSAANGYARTAIFHSERLWFGGSRDLPSFIFSSKTGAFFNFDAGTGEDNESIQADIADDQVLEIRGMATLRNFQIFTAAQEMYVPLAEGAAVTPSNFAIEPQTNYGSSVVPPIGFDGSVLFLTRTKTNLRENLYSDIEQAYNASNVTALNPEIISNPVEMTGQLEAENQPEQYAYLVNDDGSMAVFFSERDNRIQGFTKWTTDGSYKGVRSVLNRVFTVVERDISGSNELHLEYFDLDYRLDAAEKATNGSATTAWSGFTHLASQSVAVRSGNSDLGDYTIDGSGNLTTDYAVTSVEVGLPISCTLEPQPVDLAFKSGSTFGNFKKITRVVLDLYQSVTVDVDNTSILVRNVTDDLSLDISAQTKQEEIWLLGWSRSPTVTLTHNRPLPLTINGMVVEVEI